MAFQGSALRRWYGSDPGIGSLHTRIHPNTSSTPTYAYGDCHIRAHTDPNADRNSDANTTSYSYSHSHHHPYTNPNAPTHGHAHAYTNSLPESEPPGGYQRGSQLYEPHWRKSFHLAATCRDLLRALVDAYSDG